MPRHHHVLGNWRGIAPELRERGIARAFADAGLPHPLHRQVARARARRRAGWAGPTPPRDPGRAVDGKDRGRYIEDYRDLRRPAQGYQLVPGPHREPDRGRRDRARRPAPHRATAEIAELGTSSRPGRPGSSSTLSTRRPDDRPWFAACSFNAPHFPMVVPPPYDTLIDRAAIQLPASFAAGWEPLPAEVRESHVRAEVHRPGRGRLDRGDRALPRALRAGRRPGRPDPGPPARHRRAGPHDRGLHHRPRRHDGRAPADGEGPPAALRGGPAGPAARPPPRRRRRPHRQPVSMVDVAATLAELAGIDWFDEHDGRSFAGMVGAGRGRPATTSPPRPCCTTSIRTRTANTATRRPGPPAATRSTSRCARRRCAMSSGRGTRTSCTTTAATPASSTTWRAIPHTTVTGPRCGTCSRGRSWTSTRRWRARCERPLPRPLRRRDGFCRTDLPASSPTIAASAATWAR